MGISDIVKTGLPLFLLAGNVAAQSMCSQSDPVGPVYMMADESQTMIMSAGFTCTQDKVGEGQDCCTLGAVGAFSFNGTQNLTTGAGPDWLWSIAEVDFPNTEEGAFQHAEGCSPGAEPYWSYCVPVGKSGHITVTPNLQCMVGRSEGCDGDTSQYENMNYLACGASYLRYDNGGNAIPQMEVGFVEQSQSEADSMTTNPAASDSCNKQTPAASGAGRMGVSNGGLGLSLVVAVIVASLL